MAKLSRRKIASVWADELAAGRDITEKVAAYLVDARRTDEAGLIVRDTEVALAERGIVVADVTAATPLTAATRQALEKFLAATMDAKRVVSREQVDPQMLGGVRVDAAGQQLDATLRTRLNQLKASKI